MLENVYKSRLFQYSVRKTGKFYSLNVKRLSNGQSIGHGKNLVLSRERMCELLGDLDLPQEFIKNVCV